MLNICSVSVQFQNAPAHLPLVRGPHSEQTDLESLEQLIIRVYFLVLDFDYGV